MIYKGMCELVVKNKTEAVLEEIKQRGIAFDDLFVIEKARMLQFQPDSPFCLMENYSSYSFAYSISHSESA